MHDIRLSYHNIALICGKSFLAANKFGRAVNNIGAGLIGSTSIAVFAKKDAVLISIIAVVLFVCIHIALTLYSGWMHKIVDNTAFAPEEKEEQRFAHFAEQYHLTEREQEVLQVLLESDDSVQNIAEQLYISRAATDGLSCIRCRGIIPIMRRCRS